MLRFRRDPCLGLRGQIGTELVLCQPHHLLSAIAFLFLKPIEDERAELGAVGVGNRWDQLHRTLCRGASMIFARPLESLAAAPGLL